MSMGEHLRFTYSLFSTLFSTHKGCGTASATSLLHHSIRQRQPSFPLTEASNPIDSINNATASRQQMTGCPMSHGFVDM
eukprot:1158322-Pelagomonas_calceolata.AAC.6